MILIGLGFIDLELPMRPPLLDRIRLKEKDASQIGLNIESCNWYLIVNQWGSAAIWQNHCQVKHSGWPHRLLGANTVDSTQIPRMISRHLPDFGGRTLMKRGWYTCYSLWDRPHRNAVNKEDQFKRGQARRHEHSKHFQAFNQVQMLKHLGFVWQLSTQESIAVPLIIGRMTSKACYLGSNISTLHALVTNPSRT